MYLFSFFRDNGQDGLFLAASRDGLNWRPLNGDRPLSAPAVGGKLMRDPCICRGPDGLFHMTWTTSWEDRGIGVAHSKDLVTWEDATSLLTFPSGVRHGTVFTAPDDLDLLNS